jgi:hypothetical protein
MVARIDERVQNLDEKFDNCIKCSDDHEKRLRKVEGFQARVIGAAVVVSGSVTAFASWLISLIPGGSG